MMPRATTITARLAGAAVAAVVLTAPAAHAVGPRMAPPGDNGDVKIHSVGTSFMDQRNEPHVCQFYLDAFNFDANQKVTWEIDNQPPTMPANMQVLSGVLNLNASGSGTSNTYTLPAGHYKLQWTFAGEKGSAKHKVFWSDCAAVASPPPGSTVVSSGGTVVGTVTSSGAIMTSSGRIVRLLPQTGASSAVPLGGAAAAATLLGAVLVRRTRKPRASVR